MEKINLLIIGGGQLGLMLVEESYNLKEYINKIYVYTDTENTPCHYLDFNKYNYVEIIIGSYSNKELLTHICNKCDKITYEFESFPIEVFEDKNIKNKVYPSIDILKIIKDKYIQKLYIANNIKNVSFGDFDIVNSFDDIINFIKIYSYPCMLKCRNGSFDGRGNFLIKNEKDIEQFRNLESNKFYIEDYIDFDKEISIAGCLGIDNQFIYYDPVNNLHKNSILSKTIFPDDKLNDNIKNQVIDILKQILNLFNTKGIVVIEMFIKNNKIFYNELCIRVHNSYHHTLHSDVTSQFENHLRSILNLNLGLVKSNFSGNFYNIISNCQKLQDIEKIEDNIDFIKNYNKKSIGVRKIGHIVCKNKIIL
jgi:5-(carboxyamino)imidazole ribonucleotide synthase